MGRLYSSLYTVRKFSQRGENVGFLKREEREQLKNSLSFAITRSLGSSQMTSRKVAPLKATSLWSQWALLQLALMLYCLMNVKM